ncbi:MAG: TIGR02757 family protein [Crocinitomicaceae bacterium]|nr:TIGR02757 family protein [Crocinitomicaceae bacterium]
MRVVENEKKDLPSLEKCDLKNFLDEKYERFARPDFIFDDPISIPHRFSLREDIEISAFLTATIAWGNRKSIIASSNQMMKFLEDDPFRFVMDHSPGDLKKIKGAVHRTFNGTDLTFFVRALKNIYEHKGGLEKIFTDGFSGRDNSADSIGYFRKIFFSIPHPERTEKHISNPLAGSSAKRLNMFLRWMVRNDNRGVDFGIWKKIPAASLSIPLDVHTGNIARKIGLLTRAQNDWKAVRELDAELRILAPDDPVKYDYALFGLGAIEKF